MVVTTGRRKGDAKNPTSVCPEVGFSIHVRLQPDQAVSPSVRTCVHHHHQLEVSTGMARQASIRCMVEFYGSRPVPSSAVRPFAAHGTHPG